MSKEKRDRRSVKLEGQTFNYLYVDGYLGDCLYLCQCLTCGNLTTATSGQLLSGGKQSCGCMRSKLLSMRQTTHGDSKTRLYKIYRQMKSRCKESKHAAWMRNYHDRGITVCEEWENDYVAFRDWALSNGYNDELTLDRIDNDKGYCPENCRWVSMAEQANNRRTCCYITIDGVTHTMADWCRINKVNVDAACKRIEVYGWDPERAVTQPTRTYQAYGPYSRKRKEDMWRRNGKREPRKIEYNGEVKTISEWAETTGIDKNVLDWRIKHWPLDQAFTQPVRRYQ